ncbi:MAG: NAD-dependent epimerase/dehydratase family protein [Acidimicrobiia bacterium]
MRYFVTGATGFIGSHLTGQLLAEGHEVTALVRTPEQAAALAEYGVIPHLGDITVKHSLRSGMADADGVFHLAAWYRVGARHRKAAEPINVTGTRNVLETMSDLGISRGVYTSSLAVFSDTKGEVVDETYRYHGSHLSEYDRTKWLAHYQVAEPKMGRGLPLVIVQPGVVYGPGDPSAVGRLIRRYVRGKLIAVPRRSAYCWGHVADTAVAHLLAMERGNPGESYIIAGPPHPILEVMKKVASLTGRKLGVLGIPPALLGGAGAVLGMVGKVIRPLGGPSEALRVSGGATYLGDNSKAKKELGFAPRSLEEGLSETVATILEEIFEAPPE